MHALTLFLDGHALASTNGGNSTGTFFGGGGSLLSTILEVVIALGFIFIVGTIFIRLFRGLAIRAGASKSVARTVDQWFILILIILAGATVASITGLSSQLSTLTISGIGGLAVTLALQNTLSNIIAGVLMFRDGVLRLGDDIEFGSVRGVVVKLSLRTTWLKKADGSLTIVGNSNLSAGPIVNYTAMARLSKRLQL